MSYPRYVQAGTTKWEKLDCDAITDHVLAGATGTGYIASPTGLTVRVTAGVYDAVDSAGNRVYGGADDEGEVDGASAPAVIQAALTANKQVYIAAGTYSGVTELLPPTGTHITLDAGASLEVANGYTGNVFRFGDGVNNVTIDGPGVITEAGTPDLHLWTAFLIQPTSATGTYFITVRDVRVVNPHTCIKFYTDNATSWSNGCYFENVYCYNPVVFCDFDFDAVYVYPNGWNRNLFLHCKMQSGTSTTHGFKDIEHYQNTFIDCKMWDMSIGDGDVTANITADAKYTMILGGIMTYSNYEDLGDSTIALDQWTRSLGSVSTEYLTTKRILADASQSYLFIGPTAKTALDVMIKPYSNSYANAISLWDYGSTERIIMRKNLQTEYEWDIIKQTAAGNLLPLQIRFHDVTTSTYTSMIKFDTDFVCKFNAAQPIQLPRMADDPTTDGWGATQKGYLWFNTTGNVIKYWNGSAVKTLADVA